MDYFLSPALSDFLFYGLIATYLILLVFMIYQLAIKEKMTWITLLWILSSLVIPVMPLVYLVFYLFRTKKTPINI